MNKTEQFKHGAKAAVPVILGYIPVGIAYGIMARNAGLGWVQTMAFSLFVYTGAGQMASAGMIAMQISFAIIVLTVSIMNLRHIIMSTVVMERLKALPLMKRCLLSLSPMRRLQYLRWKMKRILRAGIFWALVFSPGFHEMRDQQLVS